MLKNLLVVSALLFTATTYAQRTYTVTNLTAANNAVKGDTVTFANGTYYGVFRPQTGVYYRGNATITALSSRQRSPLKLNLVIRNGRPQQVARSNGYTTYTQLADGRIIGKVGRVGDELVLRRSRWNLERSTITKRNGDTISHNGNKGTSGFGYFVQRAQYLKDSITWVQIGDSVAALSGSLVSQFDTVVNIIGKSNITIDGLTIEGGNFANIYAVGGANITIKNCIIRFAGAHGITLMQTDNATVANCTVMHCLGSGIYIRRTDRKVKSNITITNNKVANIVGIAGMDISGQEAGRAGITGYSWDGVLISDNTIDSCGYVGLEFQGNNATVQNNIIRYTNYVKDDGAGIYTFADTTTYYNRIVRNNIVLYSIGAAVGTPYTTPSARGIYLDEGTANVTVEGNTIAYCSGAGLYGNNYSDCNFINNNIFGNTQAWAAQRLTTNKRELRNITMRGNQFYPYVIEYRNLALDSTQSLLADFNAIGSVDSNYYYGASVTLVARDINGRNYRTLYPLLTSTTFDKKSSVFLPKSYYINLSNKSKVISLGGSYTDAYGNVNTSFTIKPFGSLIIK